MYILPQVRFSAAAAGAVKARSWRPSRIGRASEDELTLVFFFFFFFLKKIGKADLGRLGPPFARLKEEWWIARQDYN
jgi:hypothetical protein